MKSSVSEPVRRRILLLAYGTLLEAKVKRRVFGREVAIVPARLEGWTVRPRFVCGRYPGIVPEEGAITVGGVLRITANELAQADVYEDAPRLYRRVRVIASVNARNVRCWVYVPTPLSSNR